MYAFSTRCDLPLFSSLFRAKIRTRILSTTFGAILASNRRPINLTKKVNLLPPSKYSLPLSGLPLPAWLHASVSALSPSFRPSLPHHSTPTSARRKPLASHLASCLLGTMRLAPCSALAGGSARRPTPSEQQQKLPRVLSKKKTRGSSSPILRSGDSSV